MPPRPGPFALFLDFDGTITTRDVTDAILDALADVRWRDIDKAWRRGEIGSRECLADEIALLRATPAQVDSVIDGIDVDPGLAALFATCVRHDVPVHIVSDGFDYCIRRVLERAALRELPGLSEVRIVCNRLRCVDGRWFVGFPPPEADCTHGCATCKPAALARLAPVGVSRLFVGDGLSDRHAARVADVVFAKGNLAEFCESDGIAYTKFDTLTAVAAELAARFVD